MNPVLIRGVIVVIFALIFYSVGAITEQRKAVVSKRILLFLTAGIVLDITSTALMIAGSTNIPFTFHGVIGYTALLAMLIDAILVWKHWSRNRDGRVPRSLHIYTRVAYIWWVVAFIVGAVMSNFL
jgi:uncharacterized repeat protein (TIGR03987 family)